MAAVATRMRLGNPTTTTAVRTRAQAGTSRKRSAHSAAPAAVEWRQQLEDEEVMEDQRAPRTRDPARSTEVDKVVEGVM